MKRIWMTCAWLNMFMLFMFAQAPFAEAADPDWRRMPHQPSIASYSTCRDLVGMTRLRRPDGCSGGAPHDRERFVEACWVHDICYMTVGESRSTCDDNFHLNMQQICREGGNYADCLISAQAMASSVAIAGGGAFHNGQQWAAANCGGVWWADDRAHEKQWCGNGAVQVYHVRCEFANGDWSTHCGDMERRTFRGRAMSKDPVRLPDRAWTQVELQC